jgi:hypothetical protein
LPCSQPPPIAKLEQALKGANFQFGTDDPHQLLADHGWLSSTVLHPGDEGANLGRFTAPAGVPNLPLPLLTFILARR